jgi:hypothetical protein
MVVVVLRRKIATVCVADQPLIEGADATNQARRDVIINADHPNQSMPAVFVVDQVSMRTDVVVLRRRIATVYAVALPLIEDVDAINQGHLDVITLVVP